MTKWRIQAEFILEVQDETAARDTALNIMRQANALLVPPAGNRSPEVQSYEMASDPRTAASTLGGILVGQAANHVPWLQITDVLTNTTPMAAGDG